MPVSRWSTSLMARPVGWMFQKEWCDERTWNRSFALIARQQDTQAFLPFTGTCRRGYEEKRSDS